MFTCSNNAGKIVNPPPKKRKRKKIKGHYSISIATNRALKGELKDNGRQQGRDLTPTEPARDSAATHNRNLNV